VLAATVVTVGIGMSEVTLSSVAASIVVVGFSGGIGISTPNKAVACLEVVYADEHLEQMLRF
jgi:hypothetical protein